MNNQRYSIFCDFDGTIGYHYGDLQSMATETPQILPGVKEKFDEWNERGCYIIITTARPQSMEQLTREHLHTMGLKYDRLIMEVTNLPRVLINDRKPYTDVDAAQAIIVERDKGFKDLRI